MREQSRMIAMEYVLLVKDRNIVWKLKWILKPTKEIMQVVAIV